MKCDGRTRTQEQIYIMLHMYQTSLYITHSYLYAEAQCLISAECSDITPTHAVPSLRQSDAVFTCHPLPSVSLVYTPTLPAIQHPCFPSWGGFQQLPDGDEVLQPSCNPIQPYKPQKASAVSRHGRYFKSLSNVSSDTVSNGYRL